VALIVSEQFNIVNSAFNHVHHVATTTPHANTHSTTLHYNTPLYIISVAGRRLAVCLDLLRQLIVS